MNFLQLSPSAKAKFCSDIEPYTTKQDEIIASYLGNKHQEWITITWIIQKLSRKLEEDENIIANDLFQSLPSSYTPSPSSPSMFTSQNSNINYTKDTAKFDQTIPTEIPNLATQPDVSLQILPEINNAPDTPIRAHG